MSSDFLWSDRKPTVFGAALLAAIKPREWIDERIDAELDAMLAEGGGDADA